MRFFFYTYLCFIAIFLHGFLTGNSQHGGDKKAMVIIPAYVGDTRRINSKRLFQMIDENLLSLCKSQKPDTRIILAIPSNQYSFFAGLRPEVEKIEMLPYLSSECWMTYKTKAFIHLLKTSLKNEENILFAEGDQLYFRDFRDALPNHIDFDVAFTVMQSGEIEYGYFFIRKSNPAVLKLLTKVQSVLEEKTPKIGKCPYKYNDQKALCVILETPQHLGVETKFDSIYVSKWGLRWLALNANRVRDLPQHKFYREGRGSYQSGTCTPKYTSIFIHYRGGKKAIMAHKPCISETHDLQVNKTNFCQLVKKYDEIVVNF